LVLANRKPVPPTLGKDLIMLTLHRALFCGLLPAFAACTVASASSPKSSSDPAVTRAKATAALTGITANGKDCRDLALAGDPVAVVHIGNPDLQQTVAHVQFTLFGSAQDADKSFDGTVLATIVGKDPSGDLRGNHHIVAHEGTLRTERDVISLTPTKDKCIVNAKAKIFYKDGTGAFAGYSGTGLAEATLNFCGGAGHAVVYGRLCKAS
jgi:hypothetical protein